MTGAVPEAISALLLLAGAAIMLIGAAGVIRFPDFYTRLHASGKGDTMGQFLILVGLMIPAGLSFISLKLALIAFFIFITNPTATHALARVAWRAGLPPALGDDPHPIEYETTPPVTGPQREALLVPLDDRAQLERPSPPSEEGDA